MLEWHFKVELVSDGYTRYTSRPLKLAAEETIFSTKCNSSDLALWFRHAEIVLQNPGSCFSLLNLWSLSLHPMAYKKNRTNTFQTLRMFRLAHGPSLPLPRVAVATKICSHRLAVWIWAFYFFGLFSVYLIFLQRTRGFLSFFFSCSNS